MNSCKLHHASNIFNSVFIYKNYFLLSRNLTVVVGDSRIGLAGTKQCK